MKLIPLFPLQIVVFPNQIIPLHIFEERYKKMIAECLKKDEPFGIVSYIDKKISSVGCLCSIEKVHKSYSDGKYDIVCKGIDRFLTHSYNSNEVYLMGNVTLFHDEELPPATESHLFNDVLKKFKKLLQASITILEDTEVADPANSFEFGHSVGFDLAQKQNLLEIKTEQERLKFISKHIDSVLPKMKAAEEIKSRIRNNGHFRQFPPITFNPD